MEKGSIRSILFSIVKNFILFSFLFFTFPLSGEVLTAASDIWTPFFMVSGDRYSGIGYEILMEVARRTGDSIRIIYVPNKRAIAMFDEDKVDMMVLDSPLWSDPAQAGTYVFTDEMMTVKEFVYSLSKNFLVLKRPQDLYGKTAGIIVGYYYPLMEEAFNSGKVGKIEATSESHLIKMLLMGRADVIFMDSIAFQRTIAGERYDPKLFSRGMQLSETSLGIKVRREKASILPRFNAAIAAMKRDGTIDRIIGKYLNKDLQKLPDE